MRLDLIDVFATGPQSGNPLAVVRGDVDLSDAQMMALTRWLGFSETTFLLPATDPAADYRVRIFSPAGELPFAGHPSPIRPMVSTKMPGASRGIRGWSCRSAGSGWWKCGATWASLRFGRRHW